MNIIVFARKQEKPLCFSVSKNQLIGLCTAIFIMLPSTFLALGYSAWSGGEKTSENLSVGLQAELKEQRRSLDKVSLDAKENLASLALRLGQLQGHVIRLDALGQRLVTKAKLDKGEFDFNNPPAMGGPSSDLPSQALTVDDFVASIEALSHQIDDRELQLSIMETLIMQQDISKAVYPAGRPTEKGWISSYYGMRTDPFNGKKAFHSGIDFAGKEGSNIVSVASGVVTWSADRYGYGRMVEISHGGGYLTRYAHNKENFVRVGERVEKGQVIAHMGNSGRSTGPHVHFEVLRKGKALNPAKFLKPRK